MILTVTLNPALDKILILQDFQVHRLHRLGRDELSLTVPGGKGVNIAMALQCLGNDVVATGFAGGYEGHMLCDQLRQQGVTTSFIFSEGATRTNTSILDLKNETLTEINDFGQQIPESDQAFFLDNYEHLLHRTKMVVIAGSLPVGVPVSFIKRLIEIAHTRKIKVIVHTASKYLEPLIETSPFLINPDMRSSHVLFDRSVDGIDQFLETGKEILEKCERTEFVVFTHRIENVVAVTRYRSYILRPQGLKIVNMLGYADAYLSGFIHAYYQKLPPRRVLEYASAAGLTNVESLMKITTDVSKISDNLSRIKVEELSYAGS